MQDMTLQLAMLDKKVRMVLQKIEVLNAENTILKQEKKSLQEELDGKTSLIAKGGSQLELSVLQRSDTQKEKSEIREELDQYIQEIDQTIELLKAV